MKLMPLRCMAVVVALSPAMTTAQELSLDQAIATAREQNAKLRAGRQLTEAAAGEVRAARSPFLPELRTSASYSQYTGDVFFARFMPQPPGAPPAEGTDIGTFDSTEVVLVTLSETLYAGGGNGAKLEASRVQRSIAEQDATLIEDELVFDVSQAYMQVLLADRALGAARNSMERTERNLGSVRRLRQEEEALEVDVLAAEAQLASDRHLLLQAENDKRLAAFALNRLMGRDAGTAVAPVDVLGQAATLPSEQEVLARVAADHPEIRKADLQLDLADAGIKGARSHYRPKLSLDGMYSWLDNEMFFEGDYWGVGLNVTIPFARDWAAGAGSVAEAKARKSAAESGLEETRTGVLLLARRALSDAQEANRLVEVAEQNRRYHQEKYRVTSSAFDENLSTFDDVLRDHVDLSRAELGLYQAQYQARLTEAALRRLMAQR